MAVELPEKRTESSKPCKMSSSSAPDSPLLEHQLNPQHPLFKLAHSLDWHALEEQLGRTASGQGGRPPLPTRLLVGLHYLKGMYDESDESVVSKWVENPTGNICVERAPSSITCRVIPQH